MERRRKHCSHLACVQLWDQRDLRIGRLPCCAVERVEKSHARPDHQFGLCEVGGEFAEVLDGEGRGQGRGFWEADFFPCFAAGGLEGGFGEGVCAAWR